MSGAAKVTVNDQDQSQTLTGAPTGVGYMLGKAQRGIPDKPKLCRNFGDYGRYFGTFLADSDLAYALKRATEGGAAVWCSRATHRSGGVTTAIAAGKTFKTTTNVDTITLTAGSNLQRLALGSTLTVTNNLTGTAPTCTIAQTTPGVTASGRGQAKGALLNDVTNAKLYINTGTALAPTWTVVGTQT